MKKRVISAVIAAAIVIPLFIVGKIPFTLGVGILAALGYKEIIDLKECHGKFPSYIVLIGAILLELLVISGYKSTMLYSGIHYGIIASICLILSIPAIFDEKGKYTTRDAFYLIGSIIYLGLFCSLLVAIETGIKTKMILLYLALVAILTDTFAMLVGCLIGKHKLIPKVSPKKSVEGSVGGSLVATAVASIFYYNIVSSSINIFVLIAMTLILSVLGQLGDLLFSKIKRENNIKDFSNIMPGHGGILDRVDSLTFIVFGYIIIVSILKFL